jgi:hypothetical protein
MDILKAKFGKNITEVLDINLTTGGVSIKEGADAGIATFNKGQSYKIDVLENRINTLCAKAETILKDAQQLGGPTPSNTISKLAAAA